MSPEELACLLEREAMLGGPEDGDDPSLDALWAETKPWLLGGCVSFAQALARLVSGTVIALECRNEGSGDDGWILRHAALHRGDPQLCLAEIEAGRGDRLAVIDALGEGTFDSRMDLFWLDGHDFRVVMAEGRPWMKWSAGAKVDPSLLPGPSIALGHGYDVTDCIDRLAAKHGIALKAAIPRT